VEGDGGDGRWKKKDDEKEVGEIGDIGVNS
jgi:hypothetical protein